MYLPEASTTFAHSGAANPAALVTAVIRVCRITTARSASTDADPGLITVTCRNTSIGGRAGAWAANRKRGNAKKAARQTNLDRGRIIWRDCTWDNTPKSAPRSLHSEYLGQGYFE